MAAKQFFLPYQAATINAVAEPGAQLAFYTTDTTTKLPVYATSALSTTLSNPVVANSAGRFPDIYLNDALTYRLRILDRNGAELDDIDPFTPGDLLFTVNTNAITPQLYGAVADGVTDDSAAFVAAIAALRAEALNTGGSGFYKGSRCLFIPAGHYYLGTTVLDINHTLAIQGEGSGQFGPEAFGCSRLRWAAGTSGIRVQAANTSGNTTVDGSTHDGSGGVTLSDLCLEGGFNGTTEGDYHGLVIRNAVKAANLYIKNWPGEGVKAWAGTVNGFGAVSGNVSTTLLVGVKTESCRGGIDIRGTDANICTTINCEGYNNRQFGILDDNGAGANIHIGPHCASNGGITGTWPQTQCSDGTYRYAAKWGGDFTVAPSSGADSANWLVIEAGAAVAGVIPAWVNTPNTFRAGGDYVTLNNAGVLILNPYAENGGFSQFNNYTRFDAGTLPPKYFRGGSNLTANGTDGLVLKVHGANHLALDFDGSEAGILARNLSDAALLGYCSFVRGDTWWISPGLNIQTGALRMAGTQVVTARQTGWTASTGTPARGAFAAAAAGTVSAGYVQAEAQASRDRIAALEARFIALEADARTHGLIN